MSTIPGWIELVNKYYQMGFLLSRASWSMSRKIHRLLGMRGIEEVSTGFIGVLFALYESNGRNITELGEAVALEKSTMTGLLDRMESAGLVKREPDPEDRRAWRIKLTDRGKNIEGDIRKVVEEAYNQLTAGLTDKEGELVKKVLERIRENSRNGAEE